MTSNHNIQEMKDVIEPHELLKYYKPSDKDINFILESRRTIENILLGKDNRLLVIVGPCSIHDYDSALNYAKLLKEKNYDNLFIVMRVYFEKPRSRTGWKGFIYDPYLDNSFHINKGLAFARKLLLDITELELPIGCEFLDTITPQYLSDLVSWGAIGARTSESQIHRQLASGLSMPIGFKNLTSGDYEKAIDGIISASYSHNFLGINDEGKVSHIITKGNKFGHLILRGGDTPNYYQSSIERITTNNPNTNIIIDCSHGNSQKDHNRQLLVALYIKRLRLLNKYPIKGIMIESNISSGNQKISDSMAYGVSITDACIDIETTHQLLKLLNTNNSLEIYSLDEIRKLIREYDISISENKELLNRTVLTNNIFEADRELVGFCRNPQQLMNTSMRLALSEKVSELKFIESPFQFLLKQNDFLSLITNRDIEQNNLHTFSNNCMYLKIMEISKNLQVDFLEVYTQKIRIGYLYGRGSISHEVITDNFRGVHIPYQNIIDLNDAYNKKEIDFMLIPTYNSIIGDINLLSISAKRVGSIEHNVKLNLYCNQSKSIKDIKVMYIEPHIEKEVIHYIEKFNNTLFVIVNSSNEGCMRLLDNKTICAGTIASERNECNFFYTVDRDIVKHNITMFSLF